MRILLLLLVIVPFISSAQSKKQKALLCRLWQTEALEGVSSIMPDTALLEYDMIEFYDDETVRMSKPTDAGRYVTMGKWELKDKSKINIEGKETGKIEIEIISLTEKRFCYKIRRISNEGFAEVCMKWMK